MDQSFLSQLDQEVAHRYAFALLFEPPHNGRLRHVGAELWEYDVVRHLAGYPLNRSICGWGAVEQRNERCSAETGGT